MSIADDYEVLYPGELLWDMLLVSLYKILPTALKPLIRITTGSFAGLVSYNGDSELYELNDYRVYSSLKESGLNTDDSENSYMLLHLSAFHDPYIMNAQGEKIEKGQAQDSGMGSFKLIFDYIAEMKRLGVYEDSTIVITGDHPSAHSDSKLPDCPHLTALFVKPAGSSQETLAYSAAQVSQENLAATLVKSAQLKTEHDYGTAYFEVPEGEDRVRYHQFELYDDGTNYIVRYRVEGSGSDFAHWSEESRTDIGALYN